MITEEEIVRCDALPESKHVFDKMMPNPFGRGKRYNTDISEFIKYIASLGQCPVKIIKGNKIEVHVFNTI